MVSSVIVIEGYRAGSNSVIVIVIFCIIENLFQLQYVLYHKLPERIVIKKYNLSLT